MKLVKKLLSYLFTIVLFAFLIYVLVNRQYVSDRVILWNYTPTGEISSLADASGMSDLSRRVFYVHNPALLDSKEFNNSCKTYEETIVLGCYDGRRVYVFNVNNNKLDGIEEVTAAHEMLHAQYDRLNSKEKSDVNKLLQQQIDNLKDERIKNNLEAYKKRDPSVVLNEAHSIFATELESLSPELEKYYSKYFVDRKIVVGLSNSYEAVFTNIKNKVDEYDAKLNSLKTQIDDKEAYLNNKSSELIAWSNRLESLRNQNKISEYNSQVYSYNSAVEKYRNDVSYVKGLIQDYNSTVESRNSLAVEQNSLYKSIDSTYKEL